MERDDIWFPYEVCSVASRWVGDFDMPLARGDGGDNGGGDHDDGGDARDSAVPALLNDYDDDDDDDGTTGNEVGGDDIAWLPLQNDAHDDDGDGGGGDCDGAVQAQWNDAIFPLAHPNRSSTLSTPSPPPPPATIAVIHIIFPMLSVFVRLFHLFVGVVTPDCLSDLVAHVTLFCPLTSFVAQVRTEIGAGDPDVLSKLDDAVLAVVGDGHEERPDDGCAAHTFTQVTNRRCIGVLSQIKAFAAPDCNDFLQMCIKMANPLASFTTNVLRILAHLADRGHTDSDGMLGVCKSFVARRGDKKKKRLQQTQRPNVCLSSAAAQVGKLALLPTDKQMIFAMTQMLMCLGEQLHKQQLRENGLSGNHLHKQQPRKRKHS